MKQLIFATNNANKLSEVSAILAEKVQVCSLADIDCHDDIPEDADTLEGNAIQKALYIYNKYGKNCFADDTGLEVEALNGRPGVHTARYAFPDRNDPEANTALLLDELKDKTNRRACFRTVIALVEEGEVRVFEGEVRGIITTEKRGEKGFGYDPVFQADGYNGTFAELGVEMKNEISHRARAVQKLADYLLEA